MIPFRIFYSETIFAYLGTKNLKVLTCIWDVALPVTVTFILTLLIFKLNTTTTTNLLERERELERQTLNVTRRNQQGHRLYHHGSQ